MKECIYREYDICGEKHCCQKADDGYAMLYDSLPGYDEIDQVANDEANGIDWDSLRYAGIYTDGFIAGAFWMRRKIEK